MFKIADGRERLYQWDSDVKLRIADEISSGIDEVHFTAKYTKECYTVKIARDDTGAYVMIPNILLQKSYDIIVYAFCCTDKATKLVHEIEVVARPKPADYVYTETEVLDIKTVIDNALCKAKESGEFDGEDGVSPVVEVQDITNGHRVIITDKNGVYTFDLTNGKDGIAGKDGRDGVDGKDGLNGRDGVDGLNGKDGKDGVSVTHSWNGTKLVITSASGTESADLKGDPFTYEDFTAEQLASLKGEKGDPGGSDWNAKEGEPGHVLNRTHWVERGMVEILPETTVALEGGEGMISGNIGLEDGKTYIVNWNGAEYEIVATWSSELNGTCVFAPDDSFVVGDMPEVECVIIGGSSALTSVTLSISQKSETVHKLPGKYLPDGVPYVEKGMVVYLPEQEVTFEANEEFGGMVVALLTPEKNVLDGTYICTFDGVEYVCESVLVDDMPPTYTIGNFGLFGEGDDTGEPFAMMAAENIQMMMVKEAGTFTVGIKGMGEVPHKMDEFLLPESVESVILRSSTADSTKLFKLTVDDSGTITATEV